MSKEIEIGKKAPAFSMPATTGAKVALKDYAGKPVVLYFYPKDMTPGCTTEAIDFSAKAKAFAKEGAVIIGVSKDSLERHEKFKAKHDLNIVLASDESGHTCEKYGVWQEKSMYGKKFMGIVRSTFLIDGKGIVRQIWPKVKVKGHAEEVLAAVKQL